ncbi:hypothetical protein Syun_009253 [Stephania yunnanensis]|uniref:DUF7148 domain-containing protein n=1 Tax=Stephania yunnanensis TaxID=152371 RepID=A0AAP0KG97_9MAGN
MAIWASIGARVGDSTDLANAARDQVLGQLDATTGGNLVTRSTVYDGNNYREVSTNEDDGEGVSLGTMKLPSDTNIPRFESFLYQGANFPLPVPLKCDKVDKTKGGARYRRCDDVQTGSMNDREAAGSRFREC